MADITLISGSTLGSAEYVAEHLAEKLEEAGYSTEIQHGPLVDDLQAQGIWLIISSTHGAGDIPDNLVPFYDALQEKQADLFRRALWRYRDRQPRIRHLLRRDR